jgi:hypothetical protein
MPLLLRRLKQNKGLTMDWHKLQHKLFELDPVDPRAELENLRKLAQKPVEEPTVDLLKESYAIKPGTMPLDIDSIGDFAALAGIRLDEKQLKGLAGQARGSDPMPVAKAGRTKHPLENQLVGEVDVAGSWKHGRKNYNTLNLLGKSTSSNFSGVGSNQVTSKSTNPAGSIDQLARLLGVRDQQLFSSAITKANQGMLLSNIDKQVLGDAFSKLFQLSQSQKRAAFATIASLDSRSFSQVSSSDRALQQTTPSAQPTNANPTNANANPASNKRPRKPKTTVTSSKTYNTSKTTIKEQLFKLLEEKKKK